MHTEYLQNLRYKLQKRVRRLKSADFQQYIALLRQFWNFFDGEPTLLAVKKELQARYPDASEIADKIFQGELMEAYDEGAWAAISSEVLARFSQKDDLRPWLTKIVPHPSSTKFNAYLEVFGEMYLMPFYEYVDERLDDPRFIAARLIRFKHLCEWFWRSQLYAAWTENPSHGEKVLARKLYEFLFMEGVDFHVEPSSASGEADMIGDQQGAYRLVADAKVFNPEKSKGCKYIIQGFRQVYQYTADYNEPFGYLIIFNTSDKQLRFAVSGGGEPLPRVIVNHKCVFFVTIDIYPHETTASKRPQSDVAEITEDEVLGAVNTPELVTSDSERL